ncbi:MAG: PqqD family protein [Bacteroidales bacterium]
MKIVEGAKKREISGEVVIVIPSFTNLKKKKIISVNKTTEWLLQELDHKDFKTSDITNLLHKKYNIDKDIADKDAIKWVRALKKYGLIVK